MVIQLMEVILSIVEHKSVSKYVEAAIGELVYTVIGYMQVTMDQIESWSTDINQYIADEAEDVVSVRVSAETLLAELADSKKEKTLAVLQATASKR